MDPETHRQARVGKRVRPVERAGDQRPQIPVERADTTDPHAAARGTAANPQPTGHGRGGRCAQRRAWYDRTRRARRRPSRSRPDGNETRSTSRTCRLRHTASSLTVSSRRSGSSSSVFWRSSPSGVRCRSRSSVSTAATIVRYEHASERPFHDRGRPRLELGGCVEVSRTGVRVAELAHGGQGGPNGRDRAASMVAARLTTAADRSDCWSSTDSGTPGHGVSP